MSQQTKSDTAVLEQIREAMDRGAAGRVFGEPVTRDGLTVLPVAKVSGGGGGGGGTGPAAGGEKADMGSGSGGGFGLSAKPLGAFVIKENQVAWRPAIDVNRVIMGGQIVAAIALLTIRALARRRCR